MTTADYARESTLGHARRSVRSWVTMLLALITPLEVAACGSGSAGTNSELSYVAEFALGASTPEAEQYQLSAAPGSAIQVAPIPPGPPPDPPAPAIPSAPGPERQPGAQSMPSLPVTGWASLEPTIAWVNNGEYLAVVTYGSSSCPAGPDNVQVLADQELAFTLGSRSSDEDVCTADLSPHVTVIQIPNGISPTKSLTAHFDGHDSTIPAVDR